ncbi:MerR family transcriptional regulator [Gorillibacterium timonense]|uniref:MerR family transcriptional regulator n=1 Tax=Gorillibacterium timonense TaxID=1689269 RepID=UPI00071DC466|nr:MerR family transcriptional regulator [Gorillibacterium timonense]
MEGMRISVLAKRSGVNSSTIRYYEEQGILPAPKRSDNGYRVYSEDYLIKLELIQNAKLLGYSLNEIKEILNMLAGNMDEKTIRLLLKDKFEEIDRQIAALKTVKRSILDLLKSSSEEVSEYLQLFREDE